MCYWCENPEEDPDVEQFSEACDEALDRRADPDIWDPEYVDAIEDYLLSGPPAPEEFDESYYKLN